MNHGPQSPEATIENPTVKPCKVCRGPILPGEAYVPGSDGEPTHARHKPNRTRIIVTTPAEPLGSDCFAPQPPTAPMAMAIRLSDAECAHIDMLRRRSYELAVERGHIRR